MYQVENMYKIKFRKVKADHNRISDETMTGFCENLPMVGEMFIFVKRPNDPKTFYGMVNTSQVERIEQSNKTFKLYTHSGSIYEVTLISYPVNTN